MRQLLIFLLFASSAYGREWSLEDKVGQLFFGIVHGDTLDEEAKAFLCDTHLGNIVYFTWSNGLTSPEQVKALSNEIDAHITTITSLHPWIATDQEGGRVCRLTGSRFPTIPSAREAALEGPDEVLRVAEVVGAELAAAGINVNLAPVADVDSNPNNPVVGNRSFSSDPTIVTACCKLMIGGFHNHKVLAVLKHFPGHGDTIADSHLGLPVVNKTREQLEKVELAPFKALQGTTDFMMTSHILVPALDDKNAATLSHKILNDLLRNEWGFQGIILSDSLSMCGVSPDQTTFDEAVNSVSSAAIKAFLAGCDCLMVCRMEWAAYKPTKEQDHLLIKKVIENFRKAVDNGTIPMERVDASFNRILKVKQHRENWG